MTSEPYISQAKTFRWIGVSRPTQADMTALRVEVDAIAACGGDVEARSDLSCVFKSVPPPQLSSAHDGRGYRLWGVPLSSLSSTEFTALRVKNSNAFSWDSMPSIWDSALTASYEALLRSQRRKKKERAHQVAMRVTVAQTM